MMSWEFLLILLLPVAGFSVWELETECFSKTILDCPCLPAVHSKKSNPIQTSGNPHLTAFLFFLPVGPARALNLP